MKKCTIQEFDQIYMMIDEKEMIFEEYPERDQSDYIFDILSHPDIEEYNIKYSADSTDINLGVIGKYRLDGVPFGFNAFIITIEMEE